MILSSEKSVMKIGALVLLAYSVISIPVYAILSYKNISMSRIIMNSGIDVLLFIPIYILIVTILFSVKRTGISHNINNK